MDPQTPLPGQWDSAIIRNIAYAGLLLVATVASQIFGVTDDVITTKGGKLIEAVLGLLVVLVPLWIAYRARVTKATPPIAGTAAVAKTALREEMIAAAPTVETKRTAAQCSVFSVIGAIVLAFVVVASSGCTTNPTKTAVTSEQKADALYGEYVIAKEAGGKILDNVSVPDSVKRTVANASLRTSPIAKQGHDLIVKFAEEKAKMALLVQAATAENATKEAKDQLTAAQLKVQVAAQNLDRWITESGPQIALFISTVKGAQ